MTATVGILVNPMSGRDVRRLMARASTLTPETKRDQVGRAAIGAAAAGAERILVVREPFRISESAVENLHVGAKFEVLDIGAQLRAVDSARAAESMRAAGCRALVVLGGDGTNRAVARAWPDAPLVPISTGTNNVFPRMLEATLAGAAAGLVASGRVTPDEVAEPSKVVRLEIDGDGEDLALVDAVLIADDRVGNYRPFEPSKIRRVLLARAEPAAVGVSPIGGLILPCNATDGFGVEVECVGPDENGDVPDAVRSLLVPISPGLYRTVHVSGARQVELGEKCEWRGPGVLAFDGDRERDLAAGQRVVLRVERDGPRVIDVERALRLAAERGHYEGLPWHDGFDAPSGGGDCC